jgi:hypothetical protein
LKAGGDAVVIYAALDTFACPESSSKGGGIMAIWAAVVLHRQFPAAREKPDSEGLLRCPKSLAERQGFAPSLLFDSPPEASIATQH